MESSGRDFVSSNWSDGSKDIEGMAQKVDLDQLASNENCNAHENVRSPDSLMSDVQKIEEKKWMSWRVRSNTPTEENVAEHEDDIELEPVLQDVVMQKQDMEANTLSTYPLKSVEMCSLPGNTSARPRSQPGEAEETKYGKRLRRSSDPKFADPNKVEKVVRWLEAPFCQPFPELHSNEEDQPLEIQNYFPAQQEETQGSINFEDLYSTVSSLLVPGNSLKNISVPLPFNFSVNGLALTLSKVDHNIISQENLANGDRTKTAACQNELMTECHSMPTFNNASGSCVLDAHLLSTCLNTNTDSILNEAPEAISRASNSYSADQLEVNNAVFPFTETQKNKVTSSTKSLQMILSDSNTNTPSEESVPNIGSRVHTAACQDEFITDNMRPSTSQIVIESKDARLVSAGFDAKVVKNLNEADAEVILSENNCCASQQFDYQSVSTSPRKGNTIKVIPLTKNLLLTNDVDYDFSEIPNTRPYSKELFRNVLLNIENDAVLSQAELEIIADAFYKRHELEKNLLHRNRATRKRNHGGSKVGRPRKSEEELEKTKAEAEAIKSEMKKADLNIIKKTLKNVIERMKK